MQGKADRFLWAYQKALDELEAVVENKPSSWKIQNTNLDKKVLKIQRWMGFWDFYMCLCIIGTTPAVMEEDV